MSTTTEQETLPPKLRPAPSGGIDNNSLADLVEWFLNFDELTARMRHANTEELFQWESQSTTRTESPTGQRYIHHAERGSTVHLFIRESKAQDGDLGAPPYLYAGPMAYQRHSGERPMRIIWRLEQPLPADMFQAARVIAA